MHEIGLLRQLVRTVTAFAEENGVSEILEVVVDCGELSLVIPEYLEELYPVAAKDSILRDAKLSGKDFTIREIVVPEKGADG